MFNSYFRQKITQYKNVCIINTGREVLDEAAAAIGVGVTTDEIDRVVHEATVDRECYPSPLNYYQFPKRFVLSIKRGGNAMQLK